MMRSGKLLVVLLPIAMLAGCNAATQPEVTSSPNVEATPTCPEGLSDALEEHLATVPIGGELPQKVTVDEFPDDLDMASPLIASMSGCIFAPRIEFPDRVQGQIFGISDLSETAIISQLEEAGWEQLEFDGQPSSVWATPDQAESVMLYVGGVSPQPALDFTEWNLYVDPDQVLLLAGLAF